MKRDFADMAENSYGCKEFVSSLMSGFLSGRYEFFLESNGFLDVTDFWLRCVLDVTAAAAEYPGLRVQNGICTSIPIGGVILRVYDPSDPRGLFLTWK